MAWRTLLALGLVSLSAVACTTTVSSTTNDGGSGTGGSSAGTGGASNGGATGGGTATGGSGTGGATHTGGSGTGGGSNAYTCTPGTTPTDCTSCFTTFCCQEFNDCTDDRCRGTDDAGFTGEFNCMVDCFNGDSGLSTLSDCSDHCKGSHAVLAQTTQALVTCIVAHKGDSSTDQQCAQECFNGPRQ